MNAIKETAATLGGRPDGLLDLKKALHLFPRGVVLTQPGSKAALPGWAKPRRSKVDYDHAHQHVDRGGNVALQMGSPSGGLAVLDFDDAAVYHGWAATHPKLAETLPTQKTPSGGFHVVFRMTAETRRDARRRLAKIADGKNPGAIRLGYGELRDDSGSLVMISPSVVAGTPYRWAVPLPLHLHEIPVIDPIAVGLVTEDAVTRCVHGSATTDALAHGWTGRILTVEDAVEYATPSGPGERNHSLWLLCRALRDLAEFDELGPGDTDDPLLRDAFSAWWRVAKPIVRTKPRRTSWVEFTATWKRQPAPLSAGQFGQAVRRGLALEHTVAVPCHATGANGRQLRRLWSVCRQLQQLNGDQPFYLACRLAATILQVSRATAARLLKRLVETGAMTLQSVGAYRRNPSDRMASEYRIRLPEIEGQDARETHSKEELGVACRGRLPGRCLGRPDPDQLAHLPAAIRGDTRPWASRANEAPVVDEAQVAYVPATGCGGHGPTRSTGETTYDVPTLAKMGGTKQSACSAGARPATKTHRGADLETTDTRVSRPGEMA